jgi:heptaprenyl diphosphate synthase
MLELASLPELRQMLEEVKTAMEGSMAGASPYLEGKIRSLLSREGKMIRAALVIIAAQFGQAERAKTISLAAAVELLHVATLVHDDVVDGADIRRGLPTLSSLFGSRQAVLIGDFILVRALRLAVDLVPKGDPEALVRTLGKICEGEIEQGSQRFFLGITVRMYLRRIDGKTATLFTESMRLAASQAGCSIATVQALTRYGHCLGMAFQIMDDILDFTASDSELGKPSGSDAREGVLTLPLILALRSNGTRLFACLKNPPYSRLRLRKILKLVRTSGGVEQARGIAKGYMDRAARELESLPELRARTALSELAVILLSRKS